MIGQRLRATRIARNITQEDLAARLQVGKQQINRWEHNKTEADGHYVARLAQELGVSADYLLGLSDEQQTITGDLSAAERALLDAWRRGQLVEAIRVLVGDSTS